MGNTFEKEYILPGLVYSTERIATTALYYAAADYKDVDIVLYTYYLIAACNREYLPAILEYTRLELAVIQTEPEHRSIIWDMCEYFINKSVINRSTVSISSEVSASYFWLLLSNKENGQLECLKKSAELLNPIAMYYLGEYYRMSGETNWAVSAWRQSYYVLKLPLTLYKILIVTKDTKDNTQLHEVLALTEHYPEHPDTHFVLGCMHLFGHLVPENIPVAIAYLEPVVGGIHPNNVKTSREWILKRFF